MLAASLATVWSTLATGYDCPSSPSFIHASAKVTSVAQASCENVREEMLARIDGQFEHWHDPHNNGTYAVLDASGSDKLVLQRTTGNRKYVDKLAFVLQSTSSSTCTLLGCSESQTTSVADFGTNYCNIRMLYCGTADGCKPVEHDLNTTETSVSTSSPAAQHDIKLCLVA